MKNFTLSIILFFTAHSLIAQNEIEQLQSYFEKDVETIYLHTNKSKYVAGEYLWFKAYAFNLSQNKPSLEAINAEVNVFNAEKELVSSKKYVVTNGVFSGEFKIDSTFVGGSYYIQAHTDYLRKQGHKSHVQDFNVIDLALKDEITETSKDIDFQILPEGGYAVYGLDSSFGVKVINKSGLAEQFTAEILEDDKVINSIKSNQFGHAKFKLKAKKKSTYKINLLTDKGIKYSKAIEDIQTEGVTLQLNPLVPELLYIQLQKNFKKDKSTYSLIIHQLDKGKKIDLEFNDEKCKLAIPKEDLYEGVNTIRIFKDEVPILERLYFKKTNDEVEFDGEIVETTNQTNDSINLKLYFPYEKAQKMMSVSILPKETKAYSKKFNIISQLRLAEHITGNIENEAYYFEDVTPQKTYDLDLLLLTQGWSKNSWEDIKKNTIDADLNRRNGLTYKVSLDEKPKSTDKFLLFHGSIFNESNVVHIDKNIENVEFPNMYPIIGEKLKFSYVNKAQNYKAPKLSVEIKDFAIDTVLKTADLPLLQTSQEAEFVKLNNLSEAFIDTDMLDEVLITGEKKVKKEIPRTKVGESYYEIDDQEILRSRSLAIFLSKRGFRVTESMGELYIEPWRQSSIGASAGVAVYLDGALLGDYNMLYGAQLNQFESIIINKNGIGQGLIGSDGVIYLESRKSSFLGNKLNEMFTEIEVEQGYASTKRFYNPEYTTYDNLFFKNYGTISWSPQVLLNEENNILELQFKNTNLDYTLFIEGLDSDGKLYSFQVDRKAQ